MQGNYRKHIIRLVTFLGGIYFFFEFLMPEPVIKQLKLDQYHDDISNGFITVGAMAVFLGIINLLMLHGGRIIFRRKHWFDSLALLFGLFLMLALTGNDWISTNSIVNQSEQISNLAAFSEQIKKDFDKKNPKALPVLQRNELLVDHVQKILVSQREEITALDLGLRATTAEQQLRGVYRSDLIGYLNVAQNQLNSIVTDSALGLELSANLELAKSLRRVSGAYRELMQAAYKSTRSKKIYDLFFDGLFVALGSAMFSLLGFYIAAAAYRAFRIQSAESALMLGAALVVMLGQIPFGVWLYDGFPDLRLFLMQVPNAAAFRAVKIGAAVAGLIMAYRMWFSIESDYSQEHK